MNDLGAPMAARRVKLEPLSDKHLAGLRAACEEDQDIWDIYPVNMLGDDFDQAMQAFHANASRTLFAVIDVAQRERVVGMTCYIGPNPAQGVVEIGGTYIAPSVRGAGVNTLMKQMMIDRAVSLGFRRIEFRIDERNQRSQAAVRKLGAVKEGVLRSERVTWTGHVRDTALFSILANEWRAGTA
jgi:RimJ/RimL family protein N-acetyltransferase